MSRSDGTEAAGALVGLILGLVALIYVLRILVAVSPALAATLALVIFVKRQHPTVRLRQLIASWRGRGALIVLLGLGSLVGFGVYYMVDAIRWIAEGHEMTAHVGRFLCATAAAAAGGWLFYKINRGDFMGNIFDLIDDGDRFADFVNGGKPATVSLNAEALRLALKEDVIGQEEVVDELVSTVARRAKLARPNKPLGVFLLVGATGSGKTELAKSLAKHGFDNRLLRFDMNEFTESHSTQRLIGSPPGYVGSEEGGQLTRSITRLRSGVILFDEIEKAHSDVYKLIMGLLDEGRITEQSTGTTANASAFVVIMTSNAEHAQLGALMQTVTDTDERRRAIKDTLLGVFKPEQLARIDETFCFKPLGRHAIAQVIGKFLFGFAAEAGVKLAKVDADLLIQTILRHEKQESYGIRELVRLIEKAVIDGMLIAKEKGAKAVEIRVDERGRIDVLAAPAAAR